jgi:hypothetical protein
VRTRRFGWTQSALRVGLGEVGKVEYKVEYLVGLCTTRGWREVVGGSVVKWGGLGGEVEGWC